MNSEPTKLDRRKEIRELEAENASLRAEVERLKTVPMKYRRMAFNAQLQDETNELRQQLAKAEADRDCWYEQSELLQHQNDEAFAELRGHIDEQEKQLAASQLEAKRLRNGLIAWQTCDLDEELCDRLLSSPTSTEALDAYVAEKVKESHKVTPREGLVPHAYQLEATHNNAEYWYKWGHSAEAKEKGEQVICMAQAVFAWRNAAYAKAAEVSELTRQRDLAVSAIENLVKQKGRHNTEIAYKKLVDVLAAIKESEV